MNAKDAIWLLDKQGSCDALHGNEEIVYRALRLLAAAEGGEGTPETDALHHRLVKASEGPQWIAGKDYCDMKDHARTLEQRCAALAARVRELEPDAERYRWLVDSPLTDAGEFGIYNAYSSGTTFFGDKEHADAAIDAALKEPQ